MGSKATRIQPLPKPNNAVKMVLSRFSHATKRIMMDVVDVGHTRVKFDGDAVTKSVGSLRFCAIIS